MKKLALALLIANEIRGIIVVIGVLHYANPF